MAKKKKPVTKKTPIKKRPNRSLTTATGRAAVKHFTIDDEIAAFFEDQPEYFNMSEYLRRLIHRDMDAGGKKSDKL